MELFDKRFVHFMWDDGLKGKKCFVRDCIDDLVDVVEKGGPDAPCEVEYSGKPYSPFQIFCDDGHFDYVFAYYDPNYEVKKAFNEGKKVQFKSEDGKWCNLDDEDMLKWHIDAGCQLRVKSEEAKMWVVYLNRVTKLDSRGCYLTSCHEDKWKDVQKEYAAKTKLFVGTESEVKEWYESRQKFALVIKAWEDGKEIQFRRCGTTPWYTITSPSWDLRFEFRVKPEKKLRPYSNSAEMIADFIARFKANYPSYCEPLIWVKNKDNDAYFLIFAFYGTFIKFNDDEPLMFKELFDDYTYLDGSPCGMEVKE